MQRVFIAVILLAGVISIASARSAKTTAEPVLQGDGWSVQRAGKIPYLVENGIPVFGRFETGNPKLHLDGKWEFALATGTGHPPIEGPWEKVDVPGVWNYLRPGLLNYLGTAWYRKIFAAPDSWKSQRTVRLYFGGVNMRCRVWLNGKKLGSHEGGYTPFAFDVTDAIDFGDENTLLVEVDNRMTYVSVPPLNYEGSRMGWFEYGGIHREVYLEAHGPVTAYKLVVETAPAENNRWNVRGAVLFWDRRATPGMMGVNVEGVVADETEEYADPAAVELRQEETFAGPDGVWGMTFVGDIENPKLWSPDSPETGYTFHVNIKYKTDGGGSGFEFAQTPFGLRKFEARPDGLFLNGKPYYIRGINRHEDDPDTGLVETEYGMLRDIEMIKKLNVNHMRTAHYPADPRWYDLTDRYGIGVTEEIPLYQAGIGFTVYYRDRMRGQNPGKFKMKLSGPKQFVNPKLVSNATLTLIEMIERDINHPSILAWSIGNENWTMAKRSRRTYESLKQTARLFDPDRPVTFAILGAPWLSTHMEKTADIADFISINEYFGWYYGEVDQARKFLIKMHKRFPNKPIVVSEFGAGAVMDTSKVRAKRQDGQGTFDPEDQAKLIARQWEILRSLPFVCGGMPWIFADFRNAWFKEEHPKPFFNTKGIVTYEREPKPAYFVLREIYADIMKNPPPWAVQ